MDRERPFDLSAYAGVYLRIIDLRKHRRLPDELRARIRAKIEVLEQSWRRFRPRLSTCQSAGGAIAPNPSNCSNSRDVVFWFRARTPNMPDAPGLVKRIRSGQLVYKSNSGIRNIVDLAAPSSCVGFPICQTAQSFSRNVSWARMCVCGALTAPTPSLGGICSRAFPGTSNACVQLGFNATVISLKDEPKGYTDFDPGVAKKFVLDLHGLLKKGT